MNTTDLIRHLARQLDISQTQAKLLLKQELAALADQLEQGNEVVIRGFGKFSLRESTSGLATGNRKPTVIFKASQKFRDLVKSWKPE